MRVPASLLRQRITVEPYEGDGAYGPLYGPAFTLRARVERTRRVVRKVNAGPDVGSDVVSPVSVVVRPTRDVPALSRVTVPAAVTGTTEDYEVLDVIVGEGLARPAYIELRLG